MTFCTACGRQRAGANRFCTACGTEFRDLAQPGPPVTADADAAPAPDGTFMKPDAFRERMPAYAEPPAAEPLYAEPAYPGPAYAEPSPGGPGDGGVGYPGPVHYPGPVGRPPGRRNQIIVMAAVAIVVLGAAGGAYALVTSHGHGKAAGRQATTASIAASQATSASTAPTTSAPASPTASSGTTVAVAPGAASNPAAPQVTALVNSYFTAVNQHDYSAYASLLDQQMQQQNPESSFDSGYATTTDSAETLTSISDTGSGGLAASVTFTSQQNPADSPDNSSCDQWSITFFLVPNGAGYLIGTPPSSYQASYQAC
jgi:hypothetical protein